MAMTSGEAHLILVCCLLGLLCGFRPQLKYQRLTMVELSPNLVAVLDFCLPLHILARVRYI